jgi:hypothetical protein
MCKTKNVEATFMIEIPYMDIICYDSNRIGQFLMALACFYLGISSSAIYSEINSFYVYPGDTPAYFTPNPQQFPCAGGKQHRQRCDPLA